MGSLMTLKSKLHELHFLCEQDKNEFTRRDLKIFAPEETVKQY